MDFLKSFGIEPGRAKYHEEICYTIALLYNLLYNDVASYLNSFQLTPAQFNALMLVKHRGKDQGLSQVDLSKYLIVTPSNMTRLIDHLEKDQMVTRVAQQGDRRVNLIRITLKGSKLLDAAWPGYVVILKKQVVSLSIPDQKFLSGILRKWLKRLTAHARGDE